MVEGARLESVYRLIAYRGFESLVLRQINFLHYGLLISIAHSLPLALSDFLKVMVDLAHGY